MLCCDALVTLIVLKKRKIDRCEFPLFSCIATFFFAPAQAAVQNNLLHYITLRSAVCMHSSYSDES